MPSRKCPVSKPSQLRNRTFRHRQSAETARRILDRNFDRFFALFELVLNQADAVFDDDEFDSIIDRLKALIVIWSNSLVYRRYHPLRRWENFQKILIIRKQFKKLTKNEYVFGVVGVCSYHIVGPAVIKKMAERAEISSRFTASNMRRYIATQMLRRNVSVNERKM